MIRRAPLTSYDHTTCVCPPLDPTKTVKTFLPLGWFRRDSGVRSFARKQRPDGGVCGEFERARTCRGGGVRSACLSKEMCAQHPEGLVELRAGRRESFELRQGTYPIPGLGQRGRVAQARSQRRRDANQLAIKQHQRRPVRRCCDPVVDRNRLRTPCDHR